MKKSEELREKIETLKKELKETLLEESKILIWKDDYTKEHEKIGFFNLTKLKLILSELHKGNVLLLNHGTFGDFEVFMNSQRNRIFVSPIDGNNSFSANEGNILSFMTIYPSTWFILEGKENDLYF